MWIFMTENQTVSAFAHALRERCPGLEIKENIPLSKLTTFKIGGPAAAVAFPGCEEELVAALNCAYRCGAKMTVIGNGSNLIASDKGYNGIIIATEKLNKIKTAGNRIWCESGVSMTGLALQARDAALTGAEFLYGIPGTVGGGLYMNAGAFKGQISDVVEKSRYYDIEKDEIKEIDNALHGFSYRHSIYSANKNLIALGAWFSFAPGDAAEINALMDKYMTARRTKQPLEYPSAGSTFKRCGEFFTAKLIDDSGLKGVSVGGAQVSEKHAGFVINRENATCADVLELIDHIKKTVYEKFNVNIECEVEYLE